MDLTFFSKLRLIFCASPHERLSMFRLFRLYDRLSAHMKSFQSKSKMRCKQGCGKCCENPKIETTVFEMMPIALELVRTHQAQEFLADAAKQPNETCIFYKADAFVKGNGRCSIYAFRPLLCRLFGFSTQTNKSGGVQLVTCSILQAAHPKECEAIEKKSDSKFNPPMMHNYIMQLYGIHPTLAQKQLPINRALEEALQRVYLRRGLV